MDLPRLFRLPSDGWRKTAVINTSIVGFFAVANCSALIWSITKSGVSGNNTFSEGDCGKISLLNTFLHLLLNIASSLIIASSNFFMQVLNSPTRAEVDRAHARGRWLEIGVPSLRNVLNVSPYKSLAWVLFSFSSVPIHLLFNSSVFTVDYSGSEWSMAIISESLLHGAPYFHPGAALTLAGTECRKSDWSTVEEDRDGHDFGHVDFNVQHSSQILTAVMASVTQNLSVSDCKSEYQTCQGLRKYRNLLLVIGSGDEPAGSQGWIISDIYNMEETVGNVYNLSALDLSDNKLGNETFRSTWEPYFGNSSISQTNSLWFSSACSKGADSRFPDTCQNSCTGPLGTGWSFGGPVINETKVKSPDWNFPWLRADQSIPFRNLRPRSDWSEILDDAWHSESDAFQIWPNKCIGLPRPPFSLSNSTDDIRVQHCLAEPFEPGCKVAISNMLLAAVTVCLFTKLTLCMSVVFALRDDPLVTPGDAVASFISIPDATTFAGCAATIRDIRSRLLEQKPIQWQRRRERLAVAVSPATWTINYFFFFFLMIMLGILTSLSFAVYPWSVVSEIGSMLSHEQSMLKGGGVLKAGWFPARNFLASVLLPNVPQLILSCTYFAYNALYTRLLTESEWQSFSMGYRPLRVTNPQGEQWSTFRLQLPYRYSIPLLVTSIFLHWITSNAIFLFVSQGGYYNGLLEGGPSSLLPHGRRDPGQIVLVGFSSPAILTGFIVSHVLILLPRMLGLRRLQGSMVISRSNSLIISAACHVSTLRKVHSSSSSPGTNKPLPPLPAFRVLNDFADLDRDTGFAMRNARDVEDHPLLPYRPLGRSTTTDGRYTNAASDNSTIDAGQWAMTEGDADMESHSLITLAHANDDRERSSVRSSDTDDADNRLQDARRIEDGSNSKEDDMEFRIRLSRSRVRWGVVRMPEEFYAQFDNLEDGVKLGHLSFGIEQQGVAGPKNGPGHVYA